MANPQGTDYWFRDRIIKELDRVTAVGRRPSRIFEDWALLTEANLVELPRIYHAAAQGEEHEDLPATQELFERMRAIYHRDFCWEHFTRATAALFESAETGFMDVIGSTYMLFGLPSSQAGQFFTPFPVAQMMAQMTASNVAEEVHGRLRDAISKSPMASAMLLAGLALPEGAGFPYYLSRVVPAAMEHYDPLKVNDPCCGSGIMFLAHASVTPWWMVQMGLVEYYGQDIDRLCVTMAKINSMLFGLNGRYAPWLVAQMEHQFQMKIAGSEAPLPEADRGQPPALAAPTTNPRPEEGGVAPGASHPFQETEGWDPDDYIQQDLFGGALKEPSPVYSVQV